MILTCHDCDFRDSFVNAVHHYEVTGHQLLFRGHPQDFTRLVVEVADLRDAKAAVERMKAREMTPELELVEVERRR